MATIAWLLPSLLEGSGGHRTILQHADYLQRQGHRCVLHIEDQGGFSAPSLRKDIQRMFGYEFQEVHVGWSDIAPADMVFATIWYSARVVRDLPFPCAKAYFVQDFEAQFNPMGDGYLMAENSYRYGLYPITIGRWLPALLAQRFEADASYFDFCADLAVYHPVPDVKRERAVCFIYQPDKPRRCAEIGIEALGIVKHFMPEVKVYLYGSRVAGRIWFEHENLGLLNLADCNRLYNRCAAGLCISTTNPSRIPFEMMAAGLPVVEVHRDNTLYDLPESAVLLCESTPESLAQGLMDILRHPERTDAMGRAGIEFMGSRPLEYGLEQFGQVVDLLLSGRRPQSAPAQPMYVQPPVVAAVAAGGPPVKVTASGEAFDPGRLAFLPPVLRRIVRAIYHRVRRWLS